MYGETGERHLRPCGVSNLDESKLSQRKKKCDDEL
jgi:hypothetical protein